MEIYWDNLGEGGIFKFVFIMDCNSICARDPII